MPKKTEKSVKAAGGAKKPRAGEKKTPRGDETRALILETALEMFKERGYEDTTMRAIADRAGVSLGNAYYYFRSKEVLIQGYYARSHAEHLVAVEKGLATEKDLTERLRLVMKAKLDTSEPYHRFAGILFRTAADPESPLSPFSPESAPVRAEATQLFARVLEGSKQSIPEDLEAELPNLLWLLEMGIILFWIHDRSKNRARTRKLMNRTVDMATKLIKLASNPFLGPLRHAAVDLLRDMRVQEA